MRLSDAYQQTILKRARIVAGSAGMKREIQWVHIVDMPDILPWVRAGQLLLTTGYAFPRDEAQQRQLIRALAEKNLAGIALAVPRFFDQFPRAACAEADQLDFPLLEVPWEIPFALITEELHGAILTEQTYLIRRSEEIHRSLTRAALEATSLQDLAHTLGRLIHRATTIEDVDGRILAFYTIADEEDQLRRVTLAQGRTPPDFAAFLDERGYTAKINAASTPLRLPAEPDFGYAARIVCPIRLKGEMVGRVWIIEGETPLSELDLRAAEHAAVVIALQIAHQRALASVEARVGYSFLTTLIEGRFDVSPQARERAQLQGFSFETAYHVGMLVLDEPLPLTRDGLLRRERYADRLRLRLNQMLIPPILMANLNQISFLLPLGSDAEQVWRVLRDESGLGMGLSRAYAGVDGVQRAYREVLGMSPHVQPGVLRRYDEVLLPRVLLGDSEAREVFLAQTYGRLSEQLHGAMLVETIVAYAECGFHLRKTADCLHLHPKSMSYRLERITELTGWDFDLPQTRFELQLAAQLVRLIP